MLLAGIQNLFENLIPTAELAPEVPNVFNRVTYRALKYRVLCHDI